MNEKELQDFLNNYNSLQYHEIEDMYSNILDECNEEVNICGMTYTPSYALKQIDPTAFRCGCADYSSDDFTEYEGEYYYNSDFEDASSDYDTYLEELEEE